MVISLDPETEARLRADAATRGRTPEQLVVEAVESVYGTAIDPTEEPDAVAAIAEGLQQMKSGQGRSFDEFSREFTARFEDRHKNAA